MNSRIIQMTTKTGFVSLFWDDLKTAAAIDPKVTHKQVYDALEKEYQQGMQQRRYSNFESFRKVRDRKRYSKRSVV